MFEYTTICREHEDLILNIVINVGRSNHVYKYHGWSGLPHNHPPKIKAMDWTGKTADEEPSQSMALGGFYHL